MNSALTKRGSVSVSEKVSGIRFDSVKNDSVTIRWSEVQRATSYNLTARLTALRTKRQVLSPPTISVCVCKH